MQRQDVIDRARLWIGTPYHHQASAKQAGTDCLGLIIGIYRELYGHTPFVPNYSADWAEASGVETMITGARDYLVEISPDTARAGDVVVFRFRSDVVAKHAAILMPDHKMIHAIEGAPVTEVHISRWWRRRIAAAFSFPGVE